MLDHKKNMIDLLTGVKSSKQSYYSELKETITELEKKNMKLEIINDVTKGFNVNMSMEEMLRQVLEKLEHIVSFDRISLFLHEKQELVLTDFYPEDSFYFKVGTVLPRERSLYWQAIEENRAIFHSVSEEEAPFYHEEVAFQQLHLYSILCLPLYSKSRVIGVLSFGSKQGVKPLDEDISFLQQLGDQLAVCIENATLYNTVLRSKKEWEETFQAVLDMLIFVDLNHNILRFNPAVKDFFHMSEDEIYTKTCHDLLFSENESCPLEESYQTKEMSYQQLTMHNQRICDIYTYPVFNQAHEMYGVILYINDVTQHVHTQAQLLQSGKLAAIGEMAAGVAHELNNPLTAIMGNAQLLLRDVDDEGESFDLLKDIHKCGERSRKIIRNLLTFSRQEEYEFANCSINEAVEQVMSLIGYQIKQQNIQLTLKLAEGLPAVYGNLQQLEQIILNLLINSKDACEENETDQKRIELETTVEMIDERREVLLKVCDNGIGIDATKHKDIFHPFFTTKETMQGTGLGLSVSLGIAEAHEGLIEVNSEEGEGSTFTLRLPVATEGINEKQGG
ncbi:ATP-binding protein [Salsuginibacillus kocurii]|uniref:ATP-binding protein n=1 Tax=Salsuginibacillus kocurii TaxID=427078 RepID=UPI00036D29E9|nr:ATP-binding protein [Salsuginibacillus kocurii]